MEKTEKKEEDKKETKEVKEQKEKKEIKSVSNDIKFIQIKKQEKAEEEPEETPEIRQERRIIRTLPLDERTSENIPSQSSRQTQPQPERNKNQNQQEIYLPEKRDEKRGNYETQLKPRIALPRRTSMEQIEVSQKFEARSREEQIMSQIERTRTMQPVFKEEIEALGKEEYSLERKYESNDRRRRI